MNGVVGSGMETPDRRPPARLAEATDFYHAMFERRCRDELRVIAATKRFFERHYGDANWRAALTANPDRASELFDVAGLTLNPRSVEPRWRRDAADTPDPDAQSTATLRTWDRWATDMRHLRDLTRAAGETASVHPGFDRWRSRQERRMMHQLNPVTYAAIPNALVAYELSSGCSVGCWFCGVSAERYAGSVSYVGAAPLWRGILEAMVGRFGAAAATGFCYWATDPSDNADYLRFVEDHHRITGWRPQTTTAKPFASAALLDAIIATPLRARHANDRFSILSLRTLDRIHAQYDADALLHVDLVMQMRGSLMPKAQAGRGRAVDPVVADDAPLDQGSIACVTGFLVNLPEGRVRMISPCQANDRWPDGYRVFGERRFVDAVDYADAIDDLMAMNLVESPKPDARLKFHPTVAIVRDDGGFALKTPGQEGRIRPFVFLPRLFELLRRGRHSHAELVATLVQDYPDSLLPIGVVIQDLFDNGVLDDSDDGPLADVGDGVARAIMAKAACHA